MELATANAVSFPHAVFLYRATDEEVTSPAVRLGQGAFLVLRLLDLLAADRKRLDADAFRYQCAATDRYCRELDADSPEAAHLHGLVRTASDAQRRKDARLLAPALLAYAHYLEDDAHYEEALDVLQTLFQVAGDRLKGSDAVAATLRTARLNRKLARFDDAEAAYEQAAAVAAAAGDRHSVLLSRLGQAEVLRGRGNLGEAEPALRDILSDAKTASDTDAEARAEHGLATVLDTQGQSAEAVVHAWRSFELYADDLMRMRALHDLAIMVRALGDVTAAEQAFSEVLRRSTGYDQDTNAVVELLECASRRGDRVAFERWRTEGRRREGRMLASTQVDFYLKQGIGQARFGDFRRAEASLEKALALAQDAGLNELVFRIERIKNGLRDCEQELAKAPLEVAEPVRGESLQDVRASLFELANADV